MLLDELGPRAWWLLLAAVAVGIERSAVSTGLLPEDSYKHSFRFSRSAFEVGSIIPGTKVLISARRFQPSGCRKRAVSHSKVDFTTSAKSPHCRRRAVAAHPSQSLQLDRVSGQACAHLGQSCSIRATNHARRSPLRLKNRRTRLPPLLHNVLAPSHLVRGL